MFQEMRRRFSNVPDCGVDSNVDKVRDPFPTCGENCGEHAFGSIGMDWQTESLTDRIANAYQLSPTRPGSPRLEKSQMFGKVVLEV